MLKESWSENGTKLERYLIFSIKFTLILKTSEIGF